MSHHDEFNSHDDWPTIKGPAKGVCANCRKRPGTEIWAPGGTVAYVHGIYSMWCPICCLEANLRHAREQAEAIPGIEAKLREALKHDVSGV
jgi:hypothetical protein